MNLSLNKTSSSDLGGGVFGVALAALIDKNEHKFYNNAIAIKRARAREGSAGLWITVMRKITEIS